MDEVVFTDHHARNLLMLLNLYAESVNTSDMPLTVPELAEDIAMSMDETDDASDYHRRMIERIWNDAS